MRFGIICEGAPLGEDRKVYEYLIGRLLLTGLEGRNKSRGFPQGNKIDLIEQCGAVAKMLLEDDDYQHVIIIWDLKPAWGGKASCKHDCEAIRTSLYEAGLSLEQLQRVHLVCVEHELETWLLMDEGAILRYLKHIKDRKDYEVSISHPEREPNPKKRLEKIFTINGLRKYYAATDAEKIIQLIELRNLKKCQSFLRFESIILGNHAGTYLLKMT